MTKSRLIKKKKEHGIMLTSNKQVSLNKSSSLGRGCLT